MTSSAYPPDDLVEPPPELAADEARSAETRRRARALDKRVQWAILGVMGGVVVCVVAAVALLSAITESPASVAPADAAPPGTFRPTKSQLATLTIAPVAASSFHSEDITDGQIAIDDDKATPVYSPYSGRVTRVLVKPGEVVTRGQPLFTIDASEFVQGENDLLTAVGALNAARTAREVAVANERRQHELYDAKAAALKDWQQSQADLANADSTFRGATAGLAAVQNRLRILGKSEKEIAGLAASGKVDADATVMAPIAGTVIDRQLGVGQYIQSGASAPQYTLGDLSTVWLIANVREVDAPQIHVGQKVEARVLAYPGRVFDAKITYVAAAVDPNTRRVTVRAEVENPDGALKPQMFSTFSIVTGPESFSPGVPSSAIVYEGEETRVWVVHPDTSIELRKVQIGRSNGQLVEIASGLAQGEKVVTKGALFIDRAASSD